MATDALEVGTLSGRIELTDTASPALDNVIAKIEKITLSFGEMVGAVFTGQGALDLLEGSAHAAAGALEETAHWLGEVTIEGSHAADIEQTFDRLTANAGELGDELLGHLRDGTRGTITDMDLMTRVNQNLAVGLDLSADKMDVLAKGAFALAKTTGGDAASALDKLSDAMVTGRVRGIQLLTGKIDLAAAEQAYAEKLDTTTDHLSTEGKQAAIQEVILEKVAAATGRVGEQTTRMADKVQQARVEWQNFEEELGTAIATSPVLAVAIDAIGGAVEAAFGEGKKTLVENLAHTVDMVAIKIVDLAQYGVEALGELAKEWYALENVIGYVEQVVEGAGIIFLEAGKGFRIFFDTISGNFSSINSDVAVFNGLIDQMAADMEKRDRQFAANAAAEDALDGSVKRVNSTLETMKQKMLEASQAVIDGDKPIRDIKEANDEVLPSWERHGAAAKQTGMTIAQTAEEAKKFKEAMSELDSVGQGWEGTLATIDGETVEAIKYYLEAGVALDKLAIVYGLTAAQVKAVGEAHKEETKELKLETTAVEESAKNWAEYYKTLAELSGSRTATESANISKWITDQTEAHVKAKTDTQDFYDWLYAQADLMKQKNDKDRELEDQNSHASVVKRMKDAEDEYTFKMAHSAEYTQADLTESLHRELNAEKAWATWGSAAGGAIDTATDKAKKLDETLHHAAETTFSFEVNASNFEATATRAGVDTGAATALAKRGFSFGEILDAIRSGYSPTTPRGPRIPGFKQGGEGDFGDGTLAMLHGKEAIVPLDGGNDTAFGTTINNYHIHAVNPRLIADEVNRLQMRDLSLRQKMGTR